MIGYSKQPVEENNRKFQKPKEQKMNDSNGNVPVDLTAMQAEAVISAALNWAHKNRGGNVFDREEWAIMRAVEIYGFDFKGLAGK